MSKLSLDPGQSWLLFQGLVPELGILSRVHNCCLEVILDFGKAFLYCLREGSIAAQDGLQITEGEL